MVNRKNGREEKLGWRDNEEIAMTTSDLETADKFMRRRKRVSRMRHVPHVEALHKSIHNNTVNGESIDNHDDSLKLPKNNSKRRACKRANGLVCENRTRAEKSEETNVAPGIALEIREKDFLISKMHSEYRELERKHGKVCKEYKKLNNLSEQREIEQRELCLRYEKLLRIFQELQETKMNLTMRNQRLEIENVRSSEDVLLLKQVVYQLNAELERYQDKLTGYNGKLDVQRAVKTKTIENIGNSRDLRGDEEKIIRSWGSVNLHVLGPLLNAYNENLNEKQELVVNYEYAFANFGSRSKEIIMENESLHKEVEDLRLKCNRYMSEVNALVKNTVSLKEQHDLLLHGVIDRKKKVQEICSSYERKIESILERNEILQREHVKTMAELSNLRGKYDILSKKFEETKYKESTTIPVEVHASIIEECKKVTAELERRYEAEKRKLSARIKEIEDVQPETAMQLAAITAERNHLKVSIKNLQKDGKCMQRKNEYMRNVIYSMQISRNSIKRELSKTTAYCEQLFSEYERIIAEREKLVALLHETEKGNTSLDPLGKSITHRVDDLKNQLKFVRQSVEQQVTTIEERIRIQKFRIERMKREYRCKLRCLKNLIKQKDGIIGRLQREKCVTHVHDVSADQPADDKKLTNIYKRTEFHKS